MSVLELELQELLQSHATRFVISTVGAFADLAWDAGSHLAELTKGDCAVVVDAPSGQRRIVFQRFRGEIRYWLTSDRDPIALASSAETELGSVASIKQAVALCVEFLAGEVRPTAIQTPRIVGGVPRGYL